RWVVVAVRVGIGSVGGQLGRGGYPRRRGASGAGLVGQVGGAAHGEARELQGDRGRLAYRQAGARTKDLRVGAAVVARVERQAAGGADAHVGGHQTGLGVEVGQVVDQAEVLEVDVAVVAQHEVEGHAVGAIKRLHHAGGLGYAE